ncbi:MAG: hypothetical protein JXD23_03995 [Spirochaetales bacterium]|nr:hypothetical protein [Spirochaetales bacterium]
MMRHLSKLIILILLFSFTSCSDMIQNLSIPQPEGTDVYILIDVTASCQSALSRLKSELVLADKDYWIGAANFADFPIAPYGIPEDIPFRLLQPLSFDKNDATNAILAITINPLSGNDTPEAHLEALYQLATGEGYPPYVSPTDPGWRNSLKKAVILITDAPYHIEPGYPGHTYSQTLNALASKGIMVFGINFDGKSSNLINIVNDTNGQMYQIPSDGTGINQTIGTIIDSLL